MSGSENSVLCPENDSAVADLLGCEFADFVRSCDHPRNDSDTVREYNEGLRATFSGMKGIVLIDMERLILDQFPNPDTILSPDGVHLNRTGNDFYFMAIGRRIARSLAG